MKKNIVSVICMFFIFISFKNNFLMTIFLLLASVLFPLTLYWIDRFFNKKYDKLGITKILDFCATLFILIFFVYTASTLYLPDININSEYLYAVASRAIYFTISFEITLITLYYSLNILALKNNIIAFINSTEKFIGNNYLIHILMAVVLFIASSQNMELFIGLIGSYAFYVLSGINEIYMHKEHKEKINTEDIIFIVLLGFILIYLLVYVEQLIFCITYGNEIKNPYSWVSGVAIVGISLIKYNLNRIKTVVKKLSQRYIKHNKK